MILKFHQKMKISINEINFIKFRKLSKALELHRMIIKGM